MDSLISTKLHSNLWSEVHKLQIFERVTFNASNQINSLQFVSSNLCGLIIEITAGGKRRVITSPNPRNAYQPMCWHNFHNRMDHRKSIRDGRKIIRRCLWDAQRQTKRGRYVSLKQRTETSCSCRQENYKAEKIDYGSCLSSFFRLPNLLGPLSVLESFHFQLCVRNLAANSAPAFNVFPIDRSFLVLRWNAKFIGTDPKQHFLGALSGEKFVRSLILPSWKWNC